MPRDHVANAGGITDTRHNLSLSYNIRGAVAMDPYRNQYGAVCIYCHTPHGANSQIEAPLWNRTVNRDAAYQIYDAPTTLMRTVSAPGPTSLTCLSCHDGTIAIDSVLNMPSSGRSPTGTLSNNERGSANTAFLDDWANNEFGIFGAPQHFQLGDGVATGIPRNPDKCTLCHFESVPGSAVDDFNVFVMGTDLRDDHPVGVLYPDAAGVDGGFFNAPTVELPGSMAFFDTNGNNRADPDEVRLYDSGEGYEVECASCHDPHGVPSGGIGTNTRFSPSFLRVNNGVVGSHAGATGIVSAAPSALCLTCHTK
ncbi:MAG: hypothetical protein L3K24_04430 [Gammaproteobacteria bacterium]|nr:hypothetical protein [Gammaproteobacteria bacterium]